MLLEWVQVHCEKNIMEIKRKLIPRMTCSIMETSFTRNYVPSWKYKTFRWLTSSTIWMNRLSICELRRHIWWCLMNKTFKVGVNHGIFHVYHIWNFLIFKCTWVCSSSSSKNKSIFLNLSINSINLKTSIYLSISKMCSSFFRGEIKLARV